MRLRDLIGEKFGVLVVLNRAPNRGRRTMWLCRCACGANHEVMGENLVSGRTRSCGCLHDQHVTDSKTKHGESQRTVEYRTWLGMKTRCHNPNEPGFAYYGGRGISVCDRWRYSFEAFLADMGRRPPGTSIDRIDVNGNYEPTNCRWATPREQRLNQRPRQKKVKV